MQSPRQDHMADYERTNAREWDPDYRERHQQQTPAKRWQIVQNADSSRRTTANGRRAPPRLAEDADNDAEGQWRARQQHRDQVRIPEALVRQEKDNAVKYYEMLARQHGAFVTALYRHGTNDRNIDADGRIFGIWGDEDAVAATKKVIANWVQETTGPQRAARSSRFARIVSLTPKLREREQKRWEREVVRQRYRQHPPAQMVFNAIGSFHWPVQEFRPEDVLGSSFEAFDPIRMDTSCYIVFAAEKSMFRILGNASDVKLAMARIRKTCFQIAARQVSGLRLYLLRWDQAMRMPKHVRLDLYEHPAIMSPEEASAPKPGQMPHSVDPIQGAEYIRQSMAQTANSSEQLYSSLLRTLKQLHYYRGSIKMRIRLGTFLTTQYRVTKEGHYELEEYQNMITESQFMGHVTQEVGNRRTEQALLETLLTSHDLFTPHDNTLEDLNEVSADYTAIFTFADEAGDLRLSVNWRETQDYDTKTSQFDRSVLRWTRLDRDTGAPSNLLDVSLTDLNTSSAWQFEILASQTIEESRLPVQLLRFAEKLSINAGAARKQDPARLFVKYNPYAPLKAIQQRINYRYRVAIGNSDYTLELSRFQDRTFRRSKAISSPEPIIYEPRWSINVFREDWDTMFGENERLSIGTAADWTEEVSAWFPEDLVASPKSKSKSSEKEKEGDEPEKNLGWMQLMKKLTKIEELVRGAASLEDAMGGMTVGSS